MRILAIRLKNLASLAGEHVIDFSAEPLASAGLFAITGPTGAGKSTILDALCLALFGSTPRLDSVSPLNKVPEVDAEIGGGDERNLLRRGCGAGFAEVDFVGVDGHRYRARWEVRRAKEKINGKLQASSQSLTDLDSGTLLASGKKREFKELLEARLGLTLAQFTRAVLLAQSEFSAFLKADDNERGTLLEKLTDTGLYSRLGQAAFAAAKEARDALARLEQQAGGLQPLETDARAALEAQHAEQQAALKAAQEQLKTLEQQRQWLADLARLGQERDAAQEQLHAAEAEHEALADARRILALAEPLAPQRHRFLRQRELPALVEQARAARDRQQSSLQAIGTRLSELEQHCQQATAALKTAEQARQQAEPKLAEARREEERLAHLHSDLGETRRHAEQADLACQSGQTALLQLQTRQAEGERTLAALNQTLAGSTRLQPLCAGWDGYRPRLQQAVQLAGRLRQGQAELPALEQRAASAEQAQRSARAALDALQAQIGARGLAEQLSALNHQLDAGRQAEHELSALNELWQSRQRLLVRQQTEQTAATAQQAELEQLAQDGKALRAERDAAEQVLQVTLALLERQRLARSESVETLRAALVPGEPCPVCGSDEHPWHQADALLAALGQQDAREADAAKAALDAQDERLRTLRDRHVTLTTQLREAEQRRQTLTGEIESLDARLAAAPRHQQLLAQADDARELWLQAQLRELAEQLSAGQARQQQLLGLQQQHESLQNTWQQAREACQSATAQLQLQREALSRDGEQLDQALAELARLLPDESLDPWRQTPAQAFMQLEAQVLERCQQLEQQQELVEEQRERQSRLDQQILQQQHRAAQQQQCAQRLAELAAREAACREALARVLGDRPDSARWQQQLDGAIQQARARQAEVDRQLNEGRIERERLASEQASAEARLTELGAEQQRVAGELTAWRAAHPALDDATLEQLLHMDDALLAQARQRLQQNAEALARCRERLTERDQRLAEHRARHAELPEAEALTAQHAEQVAACQSAEQRCAESRAALIDDDRRRQQGQALRAQIDEARAEQQRWGRIAALIGSSDGGAFRKIAQAYNLDLLVQHANVQLRQLARRYRLKRGGSPLGLLVLDTEMGDELRSVHSLSGGETFLVSLALALGLASMASSKLKIESLFIDEGFGSLDPESLQIAMDALDSLQAQGRKVAVISHVAEMHERIPVQIQVQRQGNGQSTLKIVGQAG